MFLMFLRHHIGNLRFPGRVKIAFYSQRRQHRLLLTGSLCRAIVELPHRWTNESGRGGHAYLLASLSFLLQLEFVLVSPGSPLLLPYTPFQMASRTRCAKSSRCHIHPSLLVAEQQLDISTPTLPLPCTHVLQLHQMTPLSIHKPDTPFHSPPNSNKTTPKYLQTLHSPLPPLTPPVDNDDNLLLVPHSPLLSLYSLL